jgi:MFS family permease
VAGRGISASSPLPLRLIVLLCLAHTSFSGSRLTLTLQAVHLQASTFQIGLLMSLLMVVATFVSVPVGRWADRIGFQRPTLIGLCMLAVAGLLGWAFPQMLVLGATSVLVGTGYMLAHVAMNNAIGHASTPQTRAQAFGAMAVAFSVSGLVGPLISGFAIDHGGHGMAFLVMAVFPFLSAALMRWPRPLVDTAGDAQASAGRGGVMDLLRHPPLRTVFIVSGLISMGWDLFMFLLPLHGVRIGLSATAIGLLVGAFGAGSFASRMAIPWMIRAFQERGMLVGTLAATAACYVAFPFFTSFQALLPLAFIIGAVLGCGQPLSMSMVHVTAPPGRSGEAVGIRTSITSISQTVLPLLFGALGTAVGMLPVFWTAATVLASGSAFAARKLPRE